jgi:outer membrane lipoprotein carrier protein
MMRSLPMFAIMSVFICAFTFAQEDALNVKEITEKLQARSGMIDDAVATFQQHVKFGYSSIEQSFSGTLSLKKPNKYRIESDQQVVVTDGTTVWAYTPANNQVLIDRYKENENSLSPDKFLLNLPATYYVSLVGTEKMGDATVHVLKLVPKDDRSFVRSVKVWVDGNTWNARRIQLVDVNDTETTYVISDLKLNTNISPKTFTFSPPAGIEIVDLR